MTVEFGFDTCQSAWSLLLAVQKDAPAVEHTAPVPLAVLRHCINCATALNTSSTHHCQPCIFRYEAAKALGKKFIASPGGHLYCTDCGRPAPSGHVRCQSCFAACAPHLSDPAADRLRRALAA